jgi:hypothetical protein
MQHSGAGCASPTNSNDCECDCTVVLAWQPHSPKDLASPDRTLIKTGIFHKKHTEKRGQAQDIVYHLFLFNDVLMIGRASPHIDKLWFKSIFPLDKMIVWDVPDRQGRLDWIGLDWIGLDWVGLRHVCESYYVLIHVALSLFVCLSVSSIREQERH